MREYELTVITNSQLPDEEQNRMLDKYEAIFLADGGEIVNKANWGSKKLHFPIKRHFRGKYFHYDYVGLPKHLHEAERLMKIDDNVLRFLSIRIGENVDVDQRKKEIAKFEALVKEKAAAAKERGSR